VAAIRELKFSVMASAAQVVLVDPAGGAEDYARRRLCELERRWSRFLPESDVSRLNAAPEAFMLVSPDTVRLLAAMKEAWSRTNGRYDPTMLSAIMAAGYSVSIDGSGRRSCKPGARSTSSGHRCGPGGSDIVPARHGRATPQWRPRSGRRSCVPGPSPYRRTIDDVTVDPVTCAVVLPAGIGVDPGGIGKGLAADIVVTELLAAGTAGALVCIGGDLAAAGAPPTAEGWLVNVEEPRDSARTQLGLTLSGGGVATASTLSRTWEQDGRHRHHAIDPDTKTCSETDLAAVTVVAQSGWEAEAHATAALLCGADSVLDYLDLNELEGIATTLQGQILMTPGLETGPVPGHPAVAERSFA
jgi:FAD:protein FMN transferase